MAALRSWYRPCFLPLTPLSPPPRPTARPTARPPDPDPARNPPHDLHTTYLPLRKKGNRVVERNVNTQLQIVGGPNERTDYHINETAEWFYQYKGGMVLKVVDDDGEFKDIVINEGDMFLLPLRFADTVGIVLEQRRPPASLDRLRWYCRSCGGVVYEEAFHCTDLGTQIKEAVNGFRDDLEKRTCRRCGEIADVIVNVDGNSKTTHQQQSAAES
ncbi:MAG: 3-hydroxyanthranilic acid dioxygenase [Peltula sp. TS41687]|nr:MAG: 3-hydroxyanthranilic acid dioxygenase [Peltula sp. TS41687]